MGARLSGRSSSRTHANRLASRFAPRPELTQVRDRGVQRSQPVRDPASRTGRSQRGRALVEVQQRAVVASLVSSLAIIAILVVYAIVPGHYPLASGAFFALTGVAAMLVLATAMLPWKRVVGSDLFVPAFFLWALCDIALVSAAIAVSGGAHSDLYLVYLVMCIFMVAGVAYPRPARLTLSVIILASYLVTLAASGWNIGTGTLLLRLGMIVVIAGAADVMALALSRELSFRDEVISLAEERASMWSRVAGLGREAGTLDKDALLAWAVDAVCEMGLEAANVCLFNEGGNSYRVVHARGLPEEYVKEVQSSDRGMVHFVKERRTTVLVSDYDARPDAIPVLTASGFRTVIGTPLWADGELVGVLVGGTRSVRVIEAEEVAAVELLAAHAGHGLEAAQKLEHQRRDAAHFRSLITSAPDAMLVMDVEGRILEANHQVERLFAYEPQELLRLSFANLLPDSLHHFADLYREAFSDNPRTMVIGDAEDMRGMRKDGTSFPMEVVLGPIDAPEGLLVTATVRDVTERREFERRLAHQATHDHLTGLPNRAQFVGRLGEALARTPLGSTQIAVCFLDVDHFKYVNDSRGHTIGDELVAEVARRIASTARAGDMVARFGGDEFAVLVEGLNDKQGAVAYAWRLLAAFDRPFVLEGVECYLSASVGIAFGVRGDNPGDLLRNADAAMYHAKQRGRARVEMFDDTLTARAVERLEIESALHQALLGEQLSLVYQPVMELSTGEVVGVEALLRWEHPERGLVPPLTFIPIAEESGLILQIGRWVLTRACQNAARWVSELELGDRFTVSVNVSNRQLEHDRLIAEVASILQESKLPPASLVIELTESFFMRDMRAAVRRLKALKELGIRVAIDDFGTGFSSLNSLSRLPIDVVKIDKSFTDSLGTRNDAIVGAVVEVASAFHLDVVAEGIESETQRDLLIHLGCKFGQGFLLGRPVPAAAIEELFRSKSSTTN
jgi:diguanylate cyclase (GGDEF)-like protein/PAS domain S-box-containing protein